jgi:hypothetical protein
MPRKIDDHAFWAGSKESGGVFPKGAHMKSVGSTEGAGTEMDYEDTNEKIVAQQKLGVNKIKSHPMKPLFRE